MSNENNKVAMPYTFIPDLENKRWLEHSAQKNRRSMSAELNLLIEKLRLEDTEFNQKSE